MRKFFVRQSKKDDATLFFRVRKKKPYIDLLFSTYLQVDVKTWENAHSSDRKLDAFEKSAQGSVLFEKLKAIDRAVDNLLNDGILDSIPETPGNDKVSKDSYKEACEEARKKIDDVVRRAAYAEEREAALRQAEEEARLEAEREAARKANVLLYLENHIKGMADGSKKFKGESYALGTVKKWKNFYGILKEFYAEYPFTWNEIDKSLGDAFLLFMEKRGYMAMSVNKYVACFRAMINFAMVEQYHSNPAIKAFSKKKVNAEQKARQIYLNVDELQALYEMELSGLKAQVRDVFLVGCYTCQRFSDYNRLERENFTTTPRGTKVVRLTQKKTHHSIVVPILNDNLLEIVERYGYELPTINEQVFNRYIKDILNDLSETVPTLAIKERTLLTDKERRKEERGDVIFERDSKGYVIKPRYELVSSHTARRSGITNLYLTGLFDDRQMMSISGHKDLSTFSDYIKLSSDEIADAIAERMAKAKDKGGNEDLF